MNDATLTGAWPALEPGDESAEISGVVLLPGRHSAPRAGRCSGCSSWSGAAALEDFSSEEINRLVWVRATPIAESYLVPADERCADQDACRRLAFALWLRCTNRIGEGIQPSASRPANTISEPLLLATRTGLCTGLHSLRHLPPFQGGCAIV